MGQIALELNMLTCWAHDISSTQFAEQGPEILCGFTTLYCCNSFCCHNICSTSAQSLKQTSQRFCHDLHVSLNRHVCMFIIAKLPWERVRAFPRPQHNYWKARVKCPALAWEKKIMPFIQISPFHHCFLFDLLIPVHKKKMNITV